MSTSILSILPSGHLRPLDPTDPDTYARIEATSLEEALPHYFRQCPGRLVWDGQDGRPWYLDPTTMTWHRATADAIESLVAQVVGPRCWFRDRDGKWTQSRRGFGAAARAILPYLAPIAGHEPLPSVATNESQWIGFVDADVRIVGGRVVDVTAPAASHYLTARFSWAAPAWLRTDSPVDYIATNPCPMTRAMVASIVSLPDDPEGSAQQANVVWTLLGASLARGAKEVARALFLLGPRGCGKSQILTLARNMMPTEKVASSQPGELGERFGSMVLTRSWANIVDDVEEREVVSTGKLKSLIQCHPISAEIKGGDTIQIVPNCVHLFASNEVGIRTNGAHSAVHDRFAYIRCGEVGGTHRGTPGEKKHYGQQCWEQEGEEIVAHALAVYAASMRFGWFATDLEASLRETSRIVESNSRELQWWTSVAEPTGDPNDRIDLSCVHHQWLSFVESHHLLTPAKTVSDLAKSLAAQVTEGRIKSSASVRVSESQRWHGQRPDRTGVVKMAGVAEGWKLRTASAENTIEF